MQTVILAVPGAFTPTCSLKHLPGFVEKADEIKAKGVDTIACVSVNDAFVMDAWSKSADVGDKILMLADGSAIFTKVPPPLWNALAYAGLTCNLRACPRLLELIVRQWMLSVKINPPSMPQVAFNSYSARDAVFQGQPKKPRCSTQTMCPSSLNLLAAGACSPERQRPD